MAAVAGVVLLLLGAVVVLTVLMAVVELLLSPAVGDVSEEGDGLRALAGDIVTLERRERDRGLAQLWKV